MAHRHRPGTPPRKPEEDGAATLRDRVRPDVWAKLKQQADAMRAEEEKAKEAKRAAAIEVKKAEQKRLENDFAYLLENSKLDWRHHK